MSIIRSYTFWIVLVLAFSIYSFHAVENGKNAELRQQVEDLTTQVDELTTSRLAESVQDAKERNALRDHLIITLPKEEKVLTSVFANFKLSEEEGKGEATKGEAPK